MGGVPRGHAGPPRLRAVARGRAGRRSPGRHRRPPAAGRRTRGRAHRTRSSRRAWGRGYATEAGAAALEYGFEEAGLERVVGIAKPENRASVAVLRRLGMRPLGAAPLLGHSVGEVRAAGARLARGAGGGDAAAAAPSGSSCVASRRPTSSRWSTCSATPTVMRYVGAERRPLDARGGSVTGGRRGGTGRSGATGRWPSWSAPPGVSSARPACSRWTAARTSNSPTPSRAPPGVAATRQRRRAPSCAGRSPACSCPGSRRSPTRRPRLAARPGEARHGPLGPRECYASVHRGVRA